MTTGCRPDASSRASLRLHWEKRQSSVCAFRGPDRAGENGSVATAVGRGRTTRNTLSIWATFSGACRRNAWLLMGDFNQRVGERGTASRLRSALQRYSAPRHSCYLCVGPIKGGTIDHIGLSADMVVESMGVIGNYEGGNKLSDHFGIVADLSVRGILTRPVGT